MFTAESTPHVSFSSLFPLPCAVCDQSRPLVSSASLMGLESCPATWPAARAPPFTGCWMALRWPPLRLALRMVGRRFAWTKPCLGNLYVRFTTGTVSQGPGLLCCLAVMVSNGVSRKSPFVVAVCIIPNSSVLWQLPSRFTTSSL